MAVRVGRSHRVLKVKTEVATAGKEGLVRSKYFIKKEPGSDIQDTQDEGEVGKKSTVIKKEEEENEYKLEIVINPLIKRENEVTRVPSEQEINTGLIPSKKRKIDTDNQSGGDINDDPTPKQPKNWKQIYEHVKTMRSKVIAPVDTMGCSTIPLTLHKEFAPQTELDPKLFRFQLLISLMLSSQTKDEINCKAMKNMIEYFSSKGYKNGLTIDAILEVEESKLDELIFSVGFHRRKASFIKKSAEILRDQWDGDIPNTLEGLVALPGVGPKMAFLTLQQGWKLNLGIGVDTHVDRLAKMWGWVDKKSKNPEMTRVQLEKWLPKEYWREINPLLVGFGQTICLPRGRRCDLCSLSKTRLCSNIDRNILKKVQNLTKEEYDSMNSTLRGDITGLKDIEDLV